MSDVGMLHKLFDGVCLAQSAVRRVDIGGARKVDEFIGNV